MLASQAFALVVALSTTTAWAAPAFKETFDGTCFPVLLRAPRLSQTAPRAEWTHGPWQSPPRSCADSWSSRWSKSSWKTDEGADGTFTLTAGKWYGDAEADKGIQTGPDARFFAYYTKLDTPFDNEGKDLVLQVRFFTR